MSQRVVPVASPSQLSWSQNMSQVLTGSPSDASEAASRGPSLFQRSSSTPTIGGPRPSFFKPTLALSLPEPPASQPAAGTAAALAFAISSQPLPPPRQNAAAAQANPLAPFQLRTVPYQQRAAGPADVQSQTAQPSVPLQAMPRCWDARSEIEAMRAQLRSVSESLAMVVTRVGGIESSLGALREQVFAALAEQTTRSEAHAQALVQHIAALGNAVASAGARAEEAVRSVAQRQTAGDELGDVRELVRSVENRTRQSSETLNKISQLVSSFSESLQREHNEGDCGRRSQQQQQMPRPQPLPGGRSLSQARHRARGRPRSSPPARDSRGARAATNLHLERDNDASDGDVDLVAVVDGGDARVSSCESGSEGDLLGSGFSEWRDADQRAKGAPARCLGVWRELAASEATLRSVSSEELRAFLDSVGQSTAGRQATLIRRVREFFGLQSV